MEEAGLMTCIAASHKGAMDILEELKYRGHRNTLVYF